MRTMSRRQWLGAAAGAALAGRLMGSDRSLRAQGTTPLNAGMSFHNLDAVCAWVAQDKHFFEKHGLNVTIISIQGGAKTVAAMAGGDMPIAFIAAADIINARAQGLPL